MLCINKSNSSIFVHRNTDQTFMTKYTEISSVKLKID